jgi:tetratricopeptide (TPR) repeat protein
MELKSETAGDEEYKIQANSLKDQGNELFQAGKTQEAIHIYSQAIGLDPDNHVFYSNRCAAYMKSDSISKALHDAEKCVTLAPAWSKGYIRLGAAQQSLKRFDAAMDTFKKGAFNQKKSPCSWAFYCHIVINFLI